MTMMVKTSRLRLRRTVALSITLHRCMAHMLFAALALSSRTLLLV